MKINERHKRFADEYLIDLNITRAYKVVYPNVKNDETAAAAGSRLLKGVNVAEYIEKRMQDRQKRTEITQDMVVDELAAIAFANATDYAKVVERQATLTTGDGKRILLEDENGNPLMVKDVELQLTDNLTEKQVRAISGIKQGRYGIDVTQCDKVRALELLGRHLGMFKDKVEMSGQIDTNNPYAELTTEELKKLINDG